MIKNILLTAVLGLSLSSSAITVEEALTIARTHSPSVRAALAEQQAASRRVEVAGNWANPTLEFEGEGLGGDNDDFDQGEYGVTLKQTIPLGGKSKNQRAVAQQIVHVTAHAASEDALVLDAQVRSAFAEALAQQEISTVRDEQEKLGREFVAVATERYAGGGGSKLAIIQAELALEEILLEKQCCFGDLDAAKKELAVWMGVPLEEVGVPSGPFYELAEFTVKTVDEKHPTLQRFRAQEEEARAVADLAKSQNAGDLKLGAGVKYEAADEAQSFVVSASIPLSIRKTGRVERAAALLRADAIDAQREQAKRALQIQLNKMLQTYQRTAEEATQYKTRMLPMAEAAYALSRTGYDAGRYSWLELLAAQQNLAGIRIRYIEAILVAQKASAELNNFK